MCVCGVFMYASMWISTWEVVMPMVTYKENSPSYTDNEKSLKNEVKADMLWLYMAFSRDTDCMKQGE